MKTSALNKIKYFLLAIILSITVSCQNDDNDITTETNETIIYDWKLQSGNGNPKNYNLGIIFEAKDNNAPQNTYTELLDRMIGNGDFSLFKTVPFKGNKEKFNIYYAVISKSKDKNKLTYSKDMLSSIRSKANNYFSSNKNIFKTSNDPNVINNFAKNMASASGFDLNKAQNSFFYADELALNSNTINSDQTEIIKRNLKRFDYLFEQKQFDTQVYISNGIQNAYAKTDTERKKIYMGYIDYSIFGLVSSNLVHPDSFAVTFSHEFGHTFALFKDEYYPIENDASSGNIGSFSNNIVTTGFTFNSTIFDPNKTHTNPWFANYIPVLIAEKDENGSNQDLFDFIQGPIPSYDGNLIQGGSGSFGAYRTSENTIMRFYFQFSKNQWEKGWSPVQQFYINYFIKRI